MRLVLAALVLTMFGLWQGWQCTDGMPMATPAMGIMTATVGHDGPMHADAAAAEAVAGVRADGQQSPDIPGGLMAACVTVLVGMLAALLFLAAPERLLARLRAVIAAIVGDMPTLVRAPALTQLCVSRT
jgi:hypothetical protein